MSSTLLSRSTLVDEPKTQNGKLLHQSSKTQQAHDSQTSGLKGFFPGRRIENQQQILKKKDSKKRRRSSPFRIKVGCMVALRYRPGGNQVSFAASSDVAMPPDHAGIQSEDNLSFSEVWTDPQPGRDEGLALIGCCVRCCFPKFVLADECDKKATTRFLEGEVVSIVEYESQFRRQRESRRRRVACGTKVQLLIDRDKLNALPFLERIDSDVDTSKLSESAKREYLNEQRIKGGNKAIVLVFLADASGLSVDKDNVSIEARWVLRKRVAAKRYKKSAFREPETASGEIRKSQGGEKTDMNKDRNAFQLKEKGCSASNTPSRKIGKTNGPNSFSSPRYLGDGNDTKHQQEMNWRWQASRYNPFPFLTETPIDVSLMQRLSYNLVGEVVRIEPAPSNPRTLAFATIKRLVLPEHTLDGRLSSHHGNEIFDDLDLNIEAARALTHGELTTAIIYYQVPVEELLILCRRWGRYDETFSKPVSLKGSNSDKSQQVTLRMSRSYSFRMHMFADVYGSKDLLEKMESKSLALCRHCRNCLKSCNSSLNSSRGKCDSCSSMLQAVNGRSTASTCDCFRCLKDSETRGFEHFVQTASHGRDKLSAAARRSGESSKVECQGFPASRETITDMVRSDFSMVKDYFPSVTMPSSKPIVRVKPRPSKKYKKSSAASVQRPSESTKATMSLKAERGNGIRSSNAQVSECGLICSKLLPYNAKKREFEGGGADVCLREGMFSPIGDRTRNLRLADQCQARGADSEREDKTLNSRAARANQRRLLRGVAAIGVSFDTLAGREQHLRFDRSSIHAWGVFGDEDIKEGEMLVEYRGELIGNSMAEKREKEYEEAKIGSDYMFRVDGLSVCDATKQGNVARFINASCEPNCITKIISIDGTKRIVVYSKRDIRAGEELCYDYKFPLEFDEAKRIPCHCGTRDCRGYMNWDKRYVALPGQTTVVSRALNR